MLRGKGEQGVAAAGKEVGFVFAFFQLQGAPKLVVHNKGSGNTRPLGITRFRLAIHTGTSSACG